MGEAGSRVDQNTEGSLDRVPSILREARSTVPEGMEGVLGSRTSGRDKEGSENVRDRASEVQVSGFAKPKLVSARVALVTALL